MKLPPEPPSINSRDPRCPERDRGWAVALAGGTVVASAERDFDVWPASDRRWTPQCATQPDVDLFLSSIQESADPIAATETVTNSVQAGNRVGSVLSAPEGSVVELRLTGGYVSVVDRTTDAVVATIGALAVVGAHPVRVAVRR